MFHFHKYKLTKYLGYYLDYHKGVIYVFQCECGCGKTKKKGLTTKQLNRRGDKGGSERD